MFFININKVISGSIIWFWLQIIYTVQSKVAFYHSPKIVITLQTLTDAMSRIKH